MILVSCYTLLSQLINYQNYRNGIKPTDLRVFQMISGFITPNDIAITDPIFVIKLCKMSKTIFKQTPIFILGGTVGGIIYSSVVYLSGIYSDSGAVVNFMALIAIIHIIHIATFCYYLFSVLMYETVYYYILTYYLKFKIKIINQLITDRLGIFFKCSYFRNFFV